MFKENKYTAWYFKIISSAKTRVLDDYYETHHVIPRCLGGNDSTENLVSLTAREHFICHMLLTKMHNDHRLKFAFIMMTVETPNQQRKFKITSKVYEYLKKCNSEASSIRSKGKQKHNVGKKLAYNPTTEEARMFKPDEIIPEGWVMGSPLSRRKNQTGKNKGKIYYYNPETNETVAILKTDIPPEGYIKGNPKASTSPAKDKTLCYNLITYETKRIEGDIPEGWVKGSPYIWINNGNESKQILKSNKIDDGWVKGRLMTWKPRSRKQ